MASQINTVCDKLSDKLIHNENFKKIFVGPEGFTIIDDDTKKKYEIKTIETPEFVSFKGNVLSFTCQKQKYIHILNELHSYPYEKLKETMYLEVKMKHHNYD